MATTTTTKKKRSTTKRKTSSASATKKTTKSTASKTKKSAAKKATTTKKSEAVKKGRDVFERLNLWNWAMALLHAAQGVAVVVLSRDALFPVTTNFITTDTLASTDEAPVLVSATRNLFDVNLAYVVAAFFFMSAIAHLYIATVNRKKYEADLKVGINRTRWYEYGISASTMMLAIAMLSGVSDLSTLTLIFGTTLVMNLCGLIMEVHNQTTKKTNWISYVIGTISGLLPWVAIGIYFWGSNQYGSGDIPTFVYYIYASIFVFFMSFAVNMWLQYRGVGKWQDYLYGERSYMVLSLVAKSALAWQVFGGTLRP
jgi:hypothetical protein